MVIIQFQAIDTDDYENKLIPRFCKWLQEELIDDYINTYSNNIKIKQRLPNLKHANWIKWKGNKVQELTSMQILTAILNSFIINKYKDNVFKIETNSRKLIPGTHTSMDRLLRYLNSGDRYTPATEMFTNIRHKLDYMQLNAMWHLYIMTNEGYLTDSRLITQIK